MYDSGSSADCSNKQLTRLARICEVAIVSLCRSICNKPERNPWHMQHQRHVWFVLWQIASASSVVTARNEALNWGKQLTFANADCIKAITATQTRRVKASQVLGITQVAQTAAPANAILRVLQADFCFDAVDCVT